MAAEAAESKAAGELVTKAARPGRISGKIAIVTGGAQGIGAAIVRRFVKEGAQCVAIFDVADAPATSLVKELTAATPEGCVRYFHTDMSDEAAVSASVAAVTKWTGDRVDILVNNAAAFVFGEIEDVSSEAWDKVSCCRLRCLLPLLFDHCVQQCVGAEIAQQ